MKRNTRYDAIVIGGGPAGSTASTLLAMQGHRVLVLEKEKFPRYCIGESLIPYCYFTLERIGMIEAMQSSHFQEKRSVQFVNTDGSMSAPFFFAEHSDHPSSTTWQVLRSEFDQMLLDNARSKGVEVLEETRAVELIRDGDTVVGVRAARGSEILDFHARITIDASGRDAFGMKGERWRTLDEKLKKIAIWTYYKGATRGVEDPGATTVGFLPETSWFWFIPLHDDVVSVGVVAEREYLFHETRDLETVFQREVEKNAWIKHHLSTGTPINAPGLDDGPYYATSEWSYSSKHGAVDGLVLIGDALRFLDPVFSSGVLLALMGGEKVGDAVHAALEANDVSASRFDEYEASMNQAVDSMRNLVYAFYDPDFSMRDFIDRYPHLRDDVTECLIGNLSRDYDELAAAFREYSMKPAADHSSTSSQQEG